MCKDCECAKLRAENERLKEENFNFEEIIKLCRCEQYQQTLQEIKAIAKKKMQYDFISKPKEDFKEILDLITKAEEINQ